VIWEMDDDDDDDDDDGVELVKVDSHTVNVTELAENKCRW